MAQNQQLSILAQGTNASGILSGTYGGLGESISPTTAGNVLFTTDGSVWSSSSKITQVGSAVTASGTSVGFTNIPSWVKRITVQFINLSTNGTSGSEIQLGTGATPTYTTSGYTGALASSYNTTASNSINFSAGYKISNGFNINHTIHGQAIITNFGGNTWVASIGFGRTDTSNGSTGGGYITLGAALTAVRLATTNGTDSFDNGSINILYE